MAIEVIRGEALKKALDKHYRVYLCGDKSMIQPELEYIPDDYLEIGTSDYREFTADKPHYHKSNHEYNYVVRGCVKVVDIEKGEEYTFEEDSLFVIPPNTAYAGKNKAGTRVFFVKCPKGNDKMLVEKVPDAVAEWLKSWEAEYKK